MLSGSGRCISGRKEIVMKAGQHHFNCIAMHGEGCFKAFMFTIMKLKEFDKVKKISCIKSAVFKMQ